MSGDEKYTVGGLLPADLPRMKPVRVGIGHDGMCIYEWVEDNGDEIDRDS